MKLQLVERQKTRTSKKGRKYETSGYHRKNDTGRQNCALQWEGFLAYQGYATVRASFYYDE